MSKPRQSTAGWIVEYIGTQGVGKTTLNNALYKSLRSDWFFRSDLGQTGPITAAPGMIERLHRDIYFQKIEYLRSKQVDPWESITVTRQMSRVMSESLTILTNDFPRGFIMDESLFKNFPREVLKLASDTPDPLWRNRAFIHLCTRDPDLVISRYQSRVAKRARRGLMQVPPADEDVRTRVEEDKALFDKITERAKAFGCPVIVLYAEDDTQVNIRKILDFEKTIRTGAITG
ncbi:hypothetical protein [uncultured Roseobacter sp.]|uniref:hypothetical protein n=1 Tax=uncultured Roseobacter sp. TaxID=114847 RepID=UPI00261B0C08|nr:hypothetical protein [uncultured Roseobacter sp.]